MKSKSIYIFSLLLLLLFFSGCKDVTYIHPSESGIPLATDLDVKIDVDQNLNQVTFSITNKACMPVWIIDDKVYSTVNGAKRIYARAGEYTVDIKVANANGISDGTITRSFTINNPLVDFTPDLTRLAGADNKPWLMSKTASAALECG